MYLLTFFVLFLAGEMVYFSLYFMRVSKVLYAPANPTLETNAAKIKIMNKQLETVEAEIEKRTKKTPEASQNNSSVVQ